MSLYVDFLRALSLIHQRNHWIAQGPNFYGDHLLFQRLYNEVQKMADQAAEKTLGLYGELTSGPRTMAELITKYEKDEKPIQSSLDATKGFIELCTQVYEGLQKNDAMTLGLDDLVMALANQAESHAYLLQQANRG